MELKPCPFCGGKPHFERTGTHRHSCIVECGNCGARHESGDEGELSGSSWNSRDGDTQLTTLQAKLEAAEKDAARWREFESQASIGGITDDENCTVISMYCPRTEIKFWDKDCILNSVRAAIDAAIDYALASNQTKEQ